MESLPAHGKTADCRRPKTPDGRLNRAVCHVLMALIGALSVSIVVEPGSAHGQSAGSPCLTAPTLAMAGTRIVNVSTVAQLQTAMGNLQAGDTIVLANGTYNLTSTLYVNGRDNVTIRGNAGCDQVVLVGRGMDNANYDSVPHGIWSNSRNTVIAHLTIRDTYDNTVIFNGGAQSPRVYNVNLLNAGSQFIKGNPVDATQGVDNGVVEYSILEYTAGPPATDHGAGIGYTNGLSIHTADNWVIRRNLFKNFHTPDTAAYLWNPAVLMWNHSTNTLTERNTFINVDRAIAYGLYDNSGSDHQGGVIRNNFIYLQPGLMSSSRKASSDGQIIVWDSPGTKVYHNTILTNGNVVRSIEFRFNATGGEARNNLADTPIGTRDGATFTQGGNFLTATANLFVNPSAGDLHLKSTATTVIDQAPALTSVTNDIDGNTRPLGAGYDIGADEYAPTGGDTVPPSPPTGLKVTPIAASADVHEKKSLEPEI
jgi:hypothetical protein